MQPLTHTQPHMPVGLAALSQGLGSLGPHWGFAEHRGGGRLPASSQAASLLASALLPSEARSWAPRDRERLGGF